MKRISRRLCAAFIALLMLCAALPANALSAETDNYNAHDVAKLRAFFSLVNNLDISNGVAINGAAYDPDDPSTWTRCAWNDEGRLTAIDFSDKQAVGALDLSGCDALVSVCVYYNRLTGLDVSGCPLIESIEADHNQLTSIDVSGCPLLNILWLGTNSLTSLDVSANPLIERLSVNVNQLTELDVSACTELTYLDCGDNHLASLNFAGCNAITELNCKNNLLTQLDISHCTELTKLRAFGNRFKRLDLSVMNGGVEYILQAKGNGYVGTKCYIYSSGPRTVASSNTDTGAQFYGWYDGDTLVTSSADMQCTFGAGEGHYTARFESEPHTLKIDYLYENGGTAAPSYTAELEYGEAYSVVSPAVEGHYTETLTVEGVMGDEDITVTVIYLPIPDDLLMGDVDNNGVVNSLDALYLLRYTLGVQSPTAHMLLTGDVDGNGSINPIDVLLIVRMSLGLL